MKYLSLTIITTLVLLILSSCSTPKKFNYFKDIPDTVTNFTIVDTVDTRITIKRDDILTITVTSPNPEANVYFTAPGTPIPNAVTGTNTPNLNTYLVDNDGDVYLPLVGKLHLQGLTTTEARNLVTQKVAFFLKDPIVTVRFANFKITVLGEVTKPAIYILPNERVSVLDALGMAGDITFFGKKDNILLIREKDGKKVFTRLNLDSSSIFKSPNYYLQQNDILYVEPNEKKSAATDLAQTRKLSVFVSIASLIIVLLTRIK